MPGFSYSLAVWFFKKNKDVYFSSVHKVKYESFLNDPIAGNWWNLTEYSAGIQKNVAEKALLASKLRTSNYMDNFYVHKTGFITCSV